MVLTFNKNCTSCGKLPTGCSDYAEASLTAAAGETWYFPTQGGPSPLTFQKMDCCSDTPDLYTIGGFATRKLSEFQVTFSNIISTSMIMICYTCNGVSNKGVIIKRVDYGSDNGFLLDVGESLRLLLGLSYYVLQGDTITAYWDSANNDCKCSSYISNTQVRVEKDLLACPKIAGKYQFLVGIPPTICFDTTIFRNNINFSTLNMCMTVNKQPECINTDSYIAINFPHRFKGCMRVVSGADCTMPINVRPSILSSAAPGAFTEYKGYRVVCDTIWLQARNVGENWTAFRVPAIPMQPQMNVNNRVYQTPRGKIRKLYASKEIVWTFMTGILDFNTHSYIETVIEKDYVYIEGVFDASYKTSIKRLVSMSDYKIEYLDNSTKSGGLGTATFTMKEDSYSYLNDYLQ